MPLSLVFKKLSPWQRSAFCAALLERMLPNYVMFSQTAEFGESKVLRNQLDLFWQKLADRSIKINSDAQLIKLEEQIPEVQKFDFFGVYPALDTCMALVALLQGGQESGFEHIDQVSRLSANSVSYYVELMLAQEFEQQNEITLSANDIAEHPLMQWERATQQELFEFLLANKENKQTCQQLKSLALSEGLSNLGIEIN
ncbi:MAG: YjaG family protein [Alteromonadaceae bacterium]|nr:YjaG family protein [Alteromonadaceae bacterium]